MAGKCTPPLQFVPNGPAGTIAVKPPDPTPPSFGNTPTFSDDACTLLGASLCSAMDPLDSIDALPDVLTAVDGLTAAADANLDAILLELDTVIGQQPIEQSFSDFAGAQPGAESLLGDVTGIALPAIPTAPIVGPGGQTVVAPGAPPSQGGLATAGGAPYTLHLQLPLGWDPGTQPSHVSLVGPDPPFAGVQGFFREPDAQGRLRPVAHLLINPAHAGTFNATLHYGVVLTIVGITAPVVVSAPATVIIQ